jgi:cytochrome P450
MGTLSGDETGAAVAAPVFETDYDPYADENLGDPFPGYRMLRDGGTVAHLRRHNLYALPRYADVSAALSDWQTFTSANGQTMNDLINGSVQNATVCTDPPAHQTMRRVLGSPLNTLALANLRARITAEADALVDRLVGRGRFDAATELAHHLPLVIVSQLVGLPEARRSTMLELSAAAFDASGPLNSRATRALERLGALGGFSFTEIPRNELAPDSWAAKLYEASDRGEITPEQVRPMLLDYVIPSLDTTIAATANIIWLFANYPDQWETLKRSPGLIPNAINEAVRLESPIQGFSRCTTREHEIEGAVIPQGARVLLMFASANRDERKWGDPERFDIQRRSLDHVGFGYGIHRCVGANLARLEISALLTALLRRVSRFTIEDSERQLNNLMRGWKSLSVSVT